MASGALDTDKSRGRSTGASWPCMLSIDDSVRCGPTGISETLLDDPINGRKQIVVFIDSSLKFDSLIQVLAHEMIHVKQMVKGHYWFFVDEYDTDTHFWRGEQIKTDYWDRPWEKEAWRKEKLLAIKFEKLFYTLLKNA